MIKLGIILNTVYLPYAPQGARAAISAINADGGVDGHPLELEICDNQLKASAAAACARRFISESVVATVGDESSYGPDTNSPLANAKIAGIGTNPLGSGDYASPRVFPFTSGGLPFLGGAGFLLKETHAGRMGMLLESTPTAAALPDLVNKMVLEPAGSKLAGITTIPPTATDVSSQAASLIQTDGQVMATTQATTERYIAASRQQGYRGSFMVSETAADLPELAKNVDASNLDQLYGMSYFNKESPGYQHYLADMHKYQPSVYPGDLSAMTWLAVEAFAKVAGSLSDITRQGVWEAMNAQSALSTDGMTQVLNFTEPGKALGGTAPRLVAGVQSIYIDRYEDGQWKPYFTPQKPVPTFGTP
jgi:branched-chain amino acid transport system substrate-binding protein